MRRHTITFISTGLFCMLAAVAVAQEPTVKPDAQKDPLTKPVPTPVPDVVEPLEKKAEGPDAKLTKIFSKMEAFKQIIVTFEDGLITLKGAAPSAQTRDDAAGLAKKLDGVLFVQNLIDVKEVESTGNEARSKQLQSSQDEATQKKLQAIYLDIDGFKKLRVRITAGVVHLTGQVPTKEGLVQAEALAKKLDGVLYVDNQASETTDISDRVSPAVSKGKQLLKSTIAKTPLYILSIVIFIFFWWLSGAITRADRPFKRWEDKPLVRAIIKQIVRTAIFVGGVLIILEILGITTLVGAVLGTAGVAGVALGFAFRDIVENYLASVLLSLRQPFRKGDFIQVESHTGRVIRMTTRDTVLMTADGNHVRIPNALIFKSVLYNYSLNPNRRFDFVVGVGASENLTDVKRLGLQALQKLDGILIDPAPFMAIDDLGDFSVLCHFYGWVDQKSFDRTAVRTEAIRRVKLALEQAEIDMPEPIQRRIIYQMSADSQNAPAQTPVKQRVIESIDDDSWKEEANEEEQVKSQLLNGDGLEDEPDLLK